MMPVQNRVRAMMSVITNFKGLRGEFLLVGCVGVPLFDDVKRAGKVSDAAIFMAK